MSGINAINANSVTFSGKKSTKKKVDKKEAGLEKEKGSITKALTKPVKDSFHKAYGEDAKPTASLVADFAADKVLKFGVATVGIAMLFSKMKSTTNGLTKAVGKAIKTHEGLGTKIGSVISEVKNNNADYVKAARKAAQDIANKTADGEVVQNIKKSGGIKTAVKNLLKNIFKPKETFNAEGKLGQFITKTAGEKNAPKVMDKLRKIGISNGADLADTAMAVGATAVAGSGLINVTDEVTTSDNDKLAKRSRITDLQKTVESLAKTSELLGA